jgi:hypothetical protein
MQKFRADPIVETNTARDFLHIIKVPEMLLISCLLCYGTEA